jgi:hypothetical protein
VEVSGRDGVEGQRQSPAREITWTWGQPMNLWNLLLGNYIPKVAVTFKA